MKLNGRGSYLTVTIQRNIAGERMKTIIGCFYIVLLIVASVVNVSGQGRWTSLNGPWEAWEPNDIAVGYAGSVSYVYTIGGVNRELLVSKDLGDAWTRLRLNEVRAVACAKNQPLIIYVSRQDGSHHIISKSTNGGITWIDERVFNSPVSRIVIAPDNPNVVYVGLGGQQYDVNRPLWRSDNGGGSWKEIGSLNIYAKITQIAFDPERNSVIYVTARGTMGGIWKSTDGGSTWFPKNNGISNTQIASLGITPPPQANVLFAGTFEHSEGDPRIYCSTDGGDSWNVIVSITGATDIIVDPIHTTLVYAATVDGILRTKDFGASWLQRSNSFAGKNGLRMGMVQGSGQQVHLLLGTQAAFYRSNDGGEYWNEKTLGMAIVPCYRIAATDAGIFSVAYGERNNGSFVNRHVEGGIWNVVQDNSIVNSSMGSMFYGNAIAGSPMHANVLLASGTNDENLAQMIFRSSDSGSTWARVYENEFSTHPCNIIFDRNNDRIVYTADVDHVLKSSDNGITWNRLPGSPPYVYSIGIAPSQDPESMNLYAGGSRRVYKSSDGGKSWSSVSDGLPSPVVSLVCDPVNPQIVFAGTNHHRVYWTTNGGIDWQPRREGIYGDFIQSIAVQSATRVLYACAADYFGAPTRVYRSTNLGETWRDISDGLGGVLVYDLSVNTKDRNALLAATNQGVFRLSDVPAGVPDDIVVSSNFELGQNYPNPFNPSTRIAFSIQASGFVSLKVYDILGREVRELVNGTFPPGTYEVDFNAEGLASGVYLYQLQAGEFTQTRQLLLLR